MVGDLDAALRSAAVKEVELRAHALKGMFGGVAATGAAACAGRLEMLAQSGTLDGAQSIRRELEAEVRQAMIVARTMLDESGDLLDQALDAGFFLDAEDGHVRRVAGIHLLLRVDPVHRLVHRDRRFANSPSRSASASPDTS